MTREEALKHLDTILTEGEQVDALEMAIKALKEQRPHGEWIKDLTGNAHCTNCGFVLDNYIMAVFFNFCPNCGADMRDKKDDLAEIIEAVQSIKEGEAEC